MPNDGDPPGKRPQPDGPGPSTVTSILAKTFSISSIAGAGVAAALGGLAVELFSGGSWSSWRDPLGALAAISAGLTLIWYFRRLDSESPGVEAARTRVRQADDLLVSTLSARSAQEAGVPSSLVPEPVDNGARQASDDRLALAALWTVTHERLDLYHRIATGQARRSFVTAQLSMAVGFALLIVFAVFALRAHTPAAAITSGGLGAVAAAFAGYIGRTFVRSQEAAASHLRAYFDQPLEFSRYLAAERLLAAASDDLEGSERSQILGLVVQAMVGPGHGHSHNGNERKAKSPLT